MPSDSGDRPTSELGSLARLWLVALLGGLAVVGAGGLLVEALGDSDVHTTIEFGGNNERMAERIDFLDAQGRLESPGIPLDAARLAQLHGLALDVVWALVGYVLLRRVWGNAWHAGRAARPGVENAVPLVPVAAGTIGLVENLVALAALRSDGDSIRYASDAWGAIVLTLSWSKWVLAGTAILLVLAALVAATTTAAQRRKRRPRPGGGAAQGDRGGRRRLAQVGPAGRTNLQEREPDGIGISCSGGGIRAASFALGALSALERHPVDDAGAAADQDRDHGRTDADDQGPARPDGPDIPLARSILGSAKYLASVSGGGYAAAAWRIAAGADELPPGPLLGDPTTFAAMPRRYPSDDEPARNLIEHIRERRSFLATGRGGLPLAILRFAIQTAWHLALLFTAVYVAVWPLGRLLVAWPVDGLRKGEPHVEAAFGSHQWIPPLLLASVAVALWIARLGFRPGRGRRRLDAAIAGFLTLSAGGALVLLVLPFLVDVLDHLDGLLELHNLGATGIYAAIVAAVWQLARSRFRQSAKYLGGVLLAIGLVAFGLYVMVHAAAETTSHWLSPIESWLAAVVGLIAAFVLTNPDTWSLHEFYRSRLTASFVTRLVDPDRHDLRPLPITTGHGPLLAEFRDAEGPKPIFCCAAARSSNSATGVAALSMTYDPERVTLYDWRPARDDADQPIQGVDQFEIWIDQDEYRDRIPDGSRRDDLTSVMGAAAISGAAVAPAMGRKNLRTTNALLAAFNARLGAWVPNPAFEPTDDRLTSPRLINMFKEILGTYDHDNDPNLYVTDGGHWENLGLVELIRRRCRIIIAIDASGDPPGTYKAFKEAIALAETECEATVSIPADEWRRLEPDEAGLVEANYARGTVEYSSGATADLLYVKAAVSRRTPVAIQRHAASDPTFPNYSTANQLLTDRQMTWLVRLGYEATRRGIQANRELFTAGEAPAAGRSRNE